MSEDKKQIGPLRGYLSAVGDCMVLRVGMVGSYKAAIEVRAARIKNMRAGGTENNAPYWQLKRELKKRILADIDALFGDEKWPLTDDGFEWE